MLRLSPFFLAFALGCGAADTPAALETPATPAPPATEAAVAAEAPSATPAADAVLADSSRRHFGAPFALTEAVTVSEILSRPADFVDQPVQVKGRVADVCQKAGCWMVITEGEQTVRVSMKDHGFSVAKDGAGSTCQVEGTLVAKTVDPEFVAHLEGESEKPELMPEKDVAEGETVYELEATGVALEPSS